MDIWVDNQATVDIMVHELPEQQNKNSPDTPTGCQETQFPLTRIHRLFQSPHQLRSSFTSTLAWKMWMSHRSLSVMWVNITWHDVGKELWSQMHTYIHIIKTCFMLSWRCLLCKPLEQPVCDYTSLHSSATSNLLDRFHCNWWRLYLYHTFLRTTQSAFRTSLHSSIHTHLHMMVVGHLLITNFSHSHTDGMALGKICGSLFCTSILWHVYCRGQGLNYW